MSTTPIEAHHVKKNSTIMLKDHPCKVVDVKTSKTGKHGHAKCNITGVDVLTGRKYNDVAPGHIIFAAFDAQKDEMDMMDVDEGENLLKLMDANGEEVSFPYEDDDDTTKKLIAAFHASGGEVTYSVMITSAPVGPPENLKLQSIVKEFKEIKD